MPSRACLETFGVGILLITAGAAIPWTPVRAAVVLPVALVIPGWAISVAIHGWRPVSEGVFAHERRPHLPEAGLLVVLSLAFFALFSLGIAALTIPLSTLSYVVGTDVSIVVLVTVGLLRVRPETARRDPVGADSARINRSWLTWTLAVTAAGSFALTIGVLEFPETAPQVYESLALGGSWARVSGPVTIDPGSIVRIPIVVTSTAPTSTRFRVHATIDGVPLGPDIALNAYRSTTWTGSINVTVSGASCRHQVIVSLEPDAGGAPVAATSVWLATSAPGASVCGQ